LAQSSFDVVSKIDMQEVRNATDQARREISTRFDFKDTGTEVRLEESTIELKSDSEGRLKAALEVLKEKMVRRNVPLKALDEGKIEPAAKGSSRQTLRLVQGISDDNARQISKFVRSMNVKAQAQIQGDQLRVTAKSKDDLQRVIQSLKAEDFGIPLQFTNYR
jgi:uncharacterized protein YajQ (UPF0234 family)